MALRIVAALIALSTLAFWWTIALSSGPTAPTAPTETQRKPEVGCVSSLKDVKYMTSHMVDPPQGPEVLVCCNTTKGPLSIVTHLNWAPLGAKRFLELVDDGHFESVPLFRCLKGFLCQFGLAGDPARNKRYRSIKDDEPWLPQGPSNRILNGRKRFAKGYLAYAGAGPNTRSIQLIVALEDNGQLAGGSPWEVPWGELVNEHSFTTLSRIYTGYGEKGPSQGRLRNRGVDAQLRSEFPKLDFITSCFRTGDES